MSRVHQKFEKWFSHLTEVVYRHKYWALLLVVGLTVAMASQMPRLTIDTRDESFFHPDDPTLIAYNQFRDTFGQDDMFLVGLKPDEGFTNGFFSLLAQIHQELEQSVPYLDEITSLVNARVVRAQGDTLIVEDLMEQPPKDPPERQRLLDLIDHYPLYDRLLVSPDRSLTCILIRAKAHVGVDEMDLMDGFSDQPPAAPDEPSYLSNEQNVEIHEAIKQTVAQFEGRGVEFFFTGTPAFVAEIQKGIERDLVRMMPLSMLVIIIFLAVLFRRISGVLFPLMVVVFSLVSTLGIMAAVNIAISNAISILPTFLVVVGIADSVHILTIFYRNHARSKDKRQAIVDAVGFAGLPVLMTSLTTACGVASFSWADVAIIAQLGYIAPVGVMLAFVYTVVLLPALIALFPMRPGRMPSRKRQPLADRLFDRIAKTTTRRPLLVTVAGCLVIVTAGFFASQVRFSHSSLKWMPPDSDIRVHTEKLDKINGGTVMLEVTLDTGKENGLHEPEFLRKLAQAGEAVPKINLHGLAAGKAWSIADVLKETNRALNNDRGDAYQVPQSRPLIAQELLLFESSGSDDLEDFTDSTYQTARLTILAPFADAILYTDYVQQVRAYLGRLFPEAKVVLTGHMALFVQIIKHFISSMAKSFGFALVVITGLMILIIGRVRIGLLSMVANIVPIVLVFGIMGIFGIPLDMATILIGSIVLGLVVDDSIHFLHHFRKAFESTADVEKAVAETLHTTGRALTITSLVLCGGFFIYSLSFLASNARFGLLSGCAIIFALAADFLLLPALLSLVVRKKKSALMAASYNLH